jgi:hypothetical protein
MYNYNFMWNAEVATRSFWEKSEQGHHKTPKWWQACPFGYERDSWWGGKCVIPGDNKFLGEACGHKDECHHAFVSGYVDVTCAPTANDESDPQMKCVMDELASYSSKLDHCECFGFFWCESDDCYGNQCVLSTMDMKKHCKWADEPVIASYTGSQCSNCRAAEKGACETFDGTDKFKTDSSRTAGVAASAGLSAAAVVGLTIKMKKKKAPLKNNDRGNVMEMSGNRV